MKATKSGGKRRAACLGVALVAAASGAGPKAAEAQEQPTQACVDAYQATQELKLDGKIRKARESAALCSQESCPAAVRSGCTKWLRELIDNQPSLVITARDGDKDLSDAVVYLDGERVADTLSGRPLEVDPGKHVVRLERRGAPALEQTVIVLDGARNRGVVFELAAAPGKAAPAERRGVPVGPIVFGALGLASLSAFAVLALSGTRDLDRMRDTCGLTHTCLDTDVRAVKTKLVAGDVFLAAGVASFGIGIGWTIRHFTAEPDASRRSAIRWSVTPRTTGAFTSVLVSY